MNTSTGFAKRNGLSNAIILPDVLGLTGHIKPRAARGLSHDPDTTFDQIMQSFFRYANR